MKRAGRHVPALFDLAMQQQLVLASESPRRRDLLALAGYLFVVRAAHVDESSITHPDPAQNSLETAVLKAEAIAAALREERADGPVVILAADTTVALEGQMLGKPADPADARRMLLRLRGRAHEVHTGMILLDLLTGRALTAVHSSKVTMRSYDDQEIARYIASGDPFDKAGAYAIQHNEFRPVVHLEGCYLSVMGLCVCQLHLLLGELGRPARTDLPALGAAHLGFTCRLYDKITQNWS